MGRRSAEHLEFCLMTLRFNVFNKLARTGSVSRELWRADMCVSDTRSGSIL